MDLFPCVFGDFANIQRQQDGVSLSYRCLRDCVGPRCSRVSEHAVQTPFIRKLVHFSTFNFIVQLGMVQYQNLFFLLRLEVS
jgi:hypothetical protein